MRGVAVKGHRPPTHTLLQPPRLHRQCSLCQLDLPLRQAQSVRHMHNMVLVSMLADNHNVWFRQKGLRLYNNMNHVTRQM